MPSLVDTVKLTRDTDRRCKVTCAQVEEMRKLYANGTSQRAIADKFGVSKTTVCYIVNDKAREHLLEYKKRNPPKRKSNEEAREYARDLRKYKLKLYYENLLKEKEKENAY